MTLIVIPNDPNALLTTGDLDKDRASRLGQYQRYLTEQGQTWANPDLAAYAAYLQSKGLSPASIKAHLSTIRARYAAILRTDEARDALLNLVAANLPSGSHADHFALVNEKIIRIENALHPDNTPLKVVKKQDTADSEHLRLTTGQANALLAAPKANTLRGLRDTALISLMLCTGVREQELCNLEVADLRQRLGGSLALLVREGKGAKQRLIPYGELEWCLTVVEAWLKAAGITEGKVFRGIYKGDKTIRTTALTTRNIQRILEEYPVIIDGNLTHVNPHDLRRTYARRLYEAGVDPVAIQQNLGHSDLKTTLGYIGTLSADQRKPPAVYEFDLGQLKNVPERLL